MNWLRDLQKDTVYNYVDEETGDKISGTKDILEEHFNQKLRCEPGDVVKIEGGTFRYAGFEPHELGMMLKSTFEKNGRKAVRTYHSNGKQSVRSMTKDNYLKGRGSDSALTKGCVEASTKAKAEILQSRYKEWTQGGKK